MAHSTYDRYASSKGSEWMERRLAAILTADLVGYSRLMGADEAGTLASLRSLLKGTIEPLIAEHRGRIVKHMGDGVLVEFGSVVDAAKCALAWQNERRGAKDQTLQFRIGINLGDILSEDGDIFGDGVNVAARLEALAQTGGICVSSAVYDQVCRQIDAVFIDIGERQLKNIEKPVRVWQWSPHGSQAGAASMAKADKINAPDIPSIAVLPFKNISNDVEQEYFSDGITEDIITDLSKISGLFVIARNSAFAYRNRTKSVQDVARELGVRYILEGSVRKADGRVRINAQLIDSAGGEHLWAERFDRVLEDIFVLQDQITEEIVTALAIALTRAEQERVTRKTASDLQAYDYVLQGNAYHQHLTREDNVKAKDMFERAIKCDPRYAPAHAGMAWVLVHDSVQGWSSEPRRTLDAAHEHARKAIVLDDALAKAHMVLGDVFCWLRRHEQAIAEGRKAIVLDPNYADGHMALAYYLVTGGRAEEAVEEAKKALRFNPTHAHVVYYTTLSQSHYMIQEYEEARIAGELALSRSPNSRGPHIWLAASYGQLGQVHIARSHVERLTKVWPEFSVQNLIDHLPYKNESDLDRLKDGLHKAGL